jgi:uncharacterized damage-inducible protein DinB
MFSKLGDFIVSWQAESASTAKVFDALPDAKTDQAVAEGHRTLKRLAWHLVESLIEMPDHCGIKVDGHELMKNGFISDPPATMAEVKSAYEKASASLIKGLKGWTDETLQAEDEMYGMRFKRGASLSMLLSHEIHHRGEMVVLMRQAGLVPPDLYGPTKEGWAPMGMEPPKV